MCADRVDVGTADGERYSCGLHFLGVHLTPTIGGTITVGPNAVLVLAREGYPRTAALPIGEHLASKVLHSRSR